MEVYETELIYRLILKWKGSMLVADDGVELFSPDYKNNWWPRIVFNLKER